MQQRFGPFLLDTDARQLYREGTEVHLSPKAYELLAALIESRPRALAKQALHDRLWPSTFVAESNLASLVSEVRSALGDRARQPRFLRTVQRFGYAFCGEATDATPSAGASDGCVRYWLTMGSRRFELHAGANVIGREPGVAVVLDASSVSRRHATIHIGEDGARIEDLNSKNGTFLDDKRITSSSLQDGDHIRIGSVRLIFRAQSALDATETQAVRVRRRSEAQRR